MDRYSHPPGVRWLVVFFGVLAAAVAVQASPDAASPDEGKEKGALRAALGLDHGLILKVHCSPDGKWLATAGQNGVVHIYDTKKWKEVKSFEPGEHIWSVQFSPDSRTLIASGTKIHRYQVGKKWRSLEAIEVPGMSLKFDGSSIRQGATVFDVAFHPSGKVIAAATENDKVQLFDAGRGTELDGWEGHQFPPSQRPDGRPDSLETPPMVEFVDFSPDGKRAVTGGKTSETILWGLSKRGRWKMAGKLKDRPDAHRMWARFSPDGKTIAIGGTDGVIQIADGKRLKVKRQFSVFPAEFTQGFVFSPDGAHLFVAGGRRVEIFETKKWKKVGSYDAAGPVGEIKVDPKDLLPPGLPPGVEPPEGFGEMPTGEDALGTNFVELTPDGKHLIAVGIWGGVGVHEVEKIFASIGVEKPESEGEAGR